MRFNSNFGWFPESVSAWAVDRISTTVNRVPIFTINGGIAGTTRTATWSSDMSVPDIGDDPTHKFPSMKSMLFALTDEDANIEGRSSWSEVLAATSIPVPYNVELSISKTEDVVIEPSYHNDPLSTRPLDVYFQSTRGGSDRKHKDNAICMIIDGHSKSYEAGWSPPSQELYNEQCVRSLKDRSVQLRDPKHQNDELQLYSLTDHKSGYINLYSEQPLREYAWLGACQKTDIGMSNVAIPLARRLSNYGYYRVMSEHVDPANFKSVNLPHADLDKLLNVCANNQIDLLL